ncbi:MAG: hypothetical protein IH983_03110 [Planctomycetes bacterium]|nr:hypothetical protein [Planctomycetota bacterium]
MSIKALFDSDAFFRPEKEIKDWIKHSKNYQGENPNSVHLLKFFSTSKQRTYLVATPARMYCILDDSRKDNPHINWSIARNELEKDEKVIMTISTSDKTENTGLVDIGPKHKNWLFTRSLFLQASIANSIQRLILDSATRT